MRAELRPLSAVAPAVAVAAPVGCGRGRGKVSEEMRLWERVGVYEYE